MSLKEYNPHLRLTFRKSRAQFFLVFILLAAVAAGVILLKTTHLWQFLLLAYLLVSALYAFYFLQPIAGDLELKSNIVIYKRQQYSLLAVACYFNFFVVLKVSKKTNKQYLLLFQDGLSSSQWHDLVKFSKLSV